MDDTAAMVDLQSSAFAMRLANLMVATRSAQGRSTRQMARASGGTLTKSQLKELEAGTMTIDEDLVERVTELYGCDLGTILPSRLAVTVTTGIISAGGVSTAFTPNDSTSLLEAYLKLVRSLRRQRKAPAVDLRRDDIEVLAGFLHEPGETIVERLAALMGASRSQRTAMAGLFASGAVVIGLVGTAMAAGGGVTNHSSLVRGPLHDLAGVSLSGDHTTGGGVTGGSSGGSGGGWVGHSSGFATLGGDINVDPHGTGVSDDVDQAAAPAGAALIDQTPADTPPPADQQAPAPAPAPPPPAAPQVDPGTPPGPPSEPTPPAPPPPPAPPAPPAPTPDPGTPPQGGGDQGNQGGGNQGGGDQGNQGGGNQGGGNQGGGDQGNQGGGNQGGGDQGNQGGGDQGNQGGGNQGGGDQGNQGGGNQGGGHENDGNQGHQGGGNQGGGDQGNQGGGNQGGGHENDGNQGHQGGGNQGGGDQGNQGGGNQGGGHENDGNQGHQGGGHENDGNQGGGDDHGGGDHHNDHHDD